MAEDKKGIREYLPSRKQIVQGAILKGILWLGPKWGLAIFGAVLNVLAFLAILTGFNVAGLRIGLFVMIVIAVLNSQAITWAASKYFLPKYEKRLAEMDRKQIQLQDIAGEYEMAARAAIAEAKERTAWAEAQGRRYLALIESAEKRDDLV
jgi:hypothetical protein